jgi:hypothetical protein
VSYLILFGVYVPLGIIVLVIVIAIVQEIYYHHEKAQPTPIPTPRARGDRERRAYKLAVCLIVVVIAVSVVALVFELSPLSSPKIVTETFSLPAETLYPIVREVTLNANDEIIGNLTVTDISAWYNDILGEYQGFVVTTTLTDPNGNTVLQFSNNQGQTSYQNSFDYTAYYGGTYTFTFSVGSEYNPPTTATNPVVTLTYYVKT